MLEFDVDGVCVLVWIGVVILLLGVVVICVVSGGWLDKVLGILIVGVVDVDFEVLLFFLCCNVWLFLG